MSFDSSQIGKSIVVSAPSGAGKTTIVKNLMVQIPSLAFSISACSRNPRPNEIDGKDYYFLGVEGFKAAIENKEFVEWEEVYSDHFYGTLTREVDRLWSLGKVVIFDVDVVGAMTLKSLFKTQALAVFIMPPSIEILEERLKSRKTESEERIAVRIQKASWELAQASRFDLCILNEDLEIAVAQAIVEVNAFLAP